MYTAKDFELCEEFVYYIASETAVKIGRSKNAVKRLKQLQTGNDKKLELLAVIPGGADLEQELHSRFSGQRLEGEWFALKEDISKFLYMLEPANGIPELTTIEAELLPRLVDAVCDFLHRQNSPSSIVINNALFKCIRSIRYEGCVQTFYVNASSLHLDVIRRGGITVDIKQWFARWMALNNIYVMDSQWEFI